MSKKVKTEMLSYKRHLVDYYCTNCDPIAFFNIESAKHLETKDLKKLYCPFCGKKSKIKKMD